VFGTDLVWTTGKSLHAALEVIKAHGEMTRVAAGRLQPHPQQEHRRHSAGSSGQNGPDAVIAQRIRAQDVWVEVTAAH
jgi:hypothetical protein